MHDRMLHEWMNVFHESEGRVNVPFKSASGEVSSNSPGSRVSTHVYIHCKNVVVLTTYLVVT